MINDVVAFASWCLGLEAGTVSPLTDACHNCSHVLKLYNRPDTVIESSIQWGVQPAALKSLQTKIWFFQHHFFAGWQPLGFIPAAWVLSVWLCNWTAFSSISRLLSHLNWGGWVAAMATRCWLLLWLLLIPSQAALNVGAFGNDELVKRLRSSIFVETAFLEDACVEQRELSVDGRVLLCLNGISKQ